SRSETVPGASVTLTPTPAAAKTTIFTEPANTPPGSLSTAPTTDPDVDGFPTRRSTYLAQGDQTGATVSTPLPDGGSSESVYNADGSFKSNVTTTAGGVVMTTTPNAEGGQTTLTVNAQGVTTESVVTAPNPGGGTTTTTT